MAPENENKKTEEEDKLKDNALFGCDDGFYI
jgi:hypothetical protein